MMLTPIWRTRLFAIGASILAVCLGFAVAEGRFFWPSILSGAISLFLLSQWQPKPIAAVLLAALVLGYVVGNRGFAQFMLVPGFPLLPAEAVLLVIVPILAVQSAWRRELPIRRDSLNFLLLAFITFGAVRFCFDLRSFGFLAVRDFAMVYYALFFYLAQDVARSAVAARALQNTLLVSALILCGTYFLYERYPEFFFTTLAFRGTPLIAYKGDLIGTFLAVGSVLAFLRFEECRRWWLVATSVAFAAAVVATGNRAPMLGLAVAAGWLAIAHRWRFAALLAGTGAATALVILTAAAVTQTSWKRTPLLGAYERAISLVDPTGQRAYRGTETFNKGDNNLFRAVWWRVVIDETLEENPYTGLGFGRDLAAGFVRVYYPESGEEFSTRSPHNVLLTIFGRMGAVGLLLFLTVCGIIARETWRALRGPANTAGLWCAVWVMLTSACLGVVLEGPMGAVVFWTVLGVAHGSSRDTAGPLAPESATDAAGSSPPPPPPPGIAAVAAPVERP